MSYENIIYEKEDEIGIITLNRPQAMNAMSMQMLDEIRDALTKIENDDDMRVAIITGAPRPDGRPCFSAGLDMKERESQPKRATGSEMQTLFRKFEDFAKGEGPVEMSNLNRLNNQIEDMTKPTIAAIDGICTTGALSTTYACDLRIASETAQIVDFHLTRLHALGGGGIRRLPRLVGAAKAKEIWWTGEAIDGKEAWRVGLVNRVTPPDKLLEEAKSLAKKIAEVPAIAIAASKSLA
ncbi:enoyl-CoA hydratase/isomerase family protein, partial [Chloroflexota bacterium]